ncbi:MAG: carbohydrate-binding domain-containing protein [Bacteroidales bacterium]|nr:carbohydrate-binding domain-containing protein [Bacteroidales bacterium]
MKKRELFVLGIIVIACGCSKENLWGSEESSTSGVSGSTTVETVIDSEDLIANTTFARTITITFSDSDGASVSGDENGIVSIDGNAVTVNNTSTTEKVQYVLTGSTTNGYLKIYSNNKQALVLDGVSITNPGGAAINNQGKKRCFVVVNGTNTLADGSSYNTPEDEDEKAAFFSEGQLIFSGEGSLTITAKGKSGLTSDDYIHFLGTQTVNVSSSAGHGIRGKDFIMVTDGTISSEVSAAMKKGMSSDSLVVFNGGSTAIKVTGGTAYDSDDQEYKSSAGIKADQLLVMNDGTLTITNSGQGGKGISCDGPAYFQGGTVSVTVTGSNYGSSSGSGRPGGWGGGSSSSSDSSKSAKGIKIDGNIYISGGDIYAYAKNHEAIESKAQIQITGGTVYAQSSDDAINSKGNMAITGGHVCAYSTGNDGIDTNGNCYIEGGVVYAIGCGSPEVAVDANTEGGYKLYVNGGILFAIGGLEGGSVLSQACYSTSWSKNNWYALTADGETYCFKSPSSGGSGLVVSAASKPTVFTGVTPEGGTTEFNGMGVFGGSANGGSQVTISSYSSGSGMGGGTPGGGFGGWGW